jgi:hypothetical protein
LPDPAQTKELVLLQARAEFKEAFGRDWVDGDADDRHDLEELEFARIDTKSRKAIKAVLRIIRGAHAALARAPIRGGSVADFLRCWLEENQGALKELETPRFSSSESPNEVLFSVPAPKRPPNKRVQLVERMTTNPFCVARLHGITLEGKLDFDPQGHPLLSLQGDPDAIIPAIIERQKVLRQSPAAEETSVALDTPAELPSWQLTDRELAVVSILSGNLPERISWDTQPTPFKVIEAEATAIRGLRWRRG